ncbi:hypothetical protein J3F83DRAFT_272515 [Trichoderma novae-zelandiae]
MPEKLLKLYHRSDQMPLIFSQPRAASYHGSGICSGATVERANDAIMPVASRYHVKLPPSFRLESGLKLLLCMKNMHAFVTSGPLHPRGNTESLSDLSEAILVIMFAEFELCMEFVWEPALADGQLVWTIRFWLWTDSSSQGCLLHCRYWIIVECLVRETTRSGGNCQLHSSGWRPSSQRRQVDLQPAFAGLLKSSICGSLWSLSLVGRGYSKTTTRREGDDIIPMAVLDATVRLQDFVNTKLSPRANTKPGAYILDHQHCKVKHLVILAMAH